MTGIEATLYVALGGFLFAAGMGAIAALADEKKAHEATKVCGALAMFGFGTCVISLGKAGLMALGV